MMLHIHFPKELNDLVRDLSLTKNSELLAFRLKKKKNLIVLASPSTASIKEYRFFFSEEKNCVLCRYCTVSAQSWVPQYEPKDWRVFTDSSKQSLKCVLLHNGNTFASVPIAHSITLKEKYEAVKYVLDKIGYDHHK